MGCRLFSAGVDLEHKPRGFCWALSAYLVVSSTPDRSLCLSRKTLGDMRDEFLVMWRSGCGMNVQGPAGRAERICCLVSWFKQSFSSDYWIASLDSPGGGIWIWLTVTLKYGAYFICGFQGKT